MLPPSIHLLALPPPGPTSASAPSVPGIFLMLLFGRSHGGTPGGFSPVRRARVGCRLATARRRSPAAAASRRLHASRRRRRYPHRARRGRRPLAAHVGAARWAAVRDQSPAGPTDALPCGEEPLSPREQSARRTRLAYQAGPGGQQSEVAGTGTSAGGCPGETQVDEG